MAKRAVKTFHPLSMAKSLEAQNEAVGMLIARVQTLNDLADAVSAESLRKMIKDTQDEAERVRALWWPDEDE